MSRFSRLSVVALMVSVGLVAAGCTSSAPTANVSPGASPSPSEAASPSPSPSPTSSGPLGITAAPVHNGEVGLTFAPITLAAEGGIQPYSWAVGTGALPTGLTLSADGVISGSVTKDGVFKFTLAVADSGGSQATKSTSIQVFKTLKVTARCANTCVVGKGCAKCGSFGTVTGGETPYAYKVTSGAVPSGMKLSALSLVGGFPAGSYPLTVQVSDKLGANASVSANWSVYAGLSIGAGSSCTKSGVGGPPSCSTTGWSYAGGNPSVAPHISVLKISQYCPATGCYPLPTGLPPGWVATASGGTLSFSMSVSSCSPAPNSYEAVLTIQLKDTTTCATTVAPTANLIVDAPNGC